MFSLQSNIRIKLKRKLNSVFHGIVCVCACACNNKNNTKINASPGACGRQNVGLSAPLTSITVCALLQESGGADGRICCDQTLSQRFIDAQLTSVRSNVLCSTARMCKQTHLFCA